MQHSDLAQDIPDNDALARLMAGWQTWDWESFQSWGHAPHDEADVFEAWLRLRLERDAEAEAEADNPRQREAQCARRAAGVTCLQNEAATELRLAAAYARGREASRCADCGADTRGRRGAYCEPCEGQRRVGPF